MGNYFLADFLDSYYWGNQIGKKASNRKLAVREIIKLRIINKLLKEEIKLKEEESALAAIPNAILITLRYYAPLFYLKNKEVEIAGSTYTAYVSGDSPGVDMPDAVFYKEDNIIYGKSIDPAGIEGCAASTDELIWIGNSLYNTLFSPPTLNEMKIYKAYE